MPAPAAGHFGFQRTVNRSRRSGPRRSPLGESLAKRDLSLRVATRAWNCANTRQPALPAAAHALRARYSHATQTMMNSRRLMITPQTDEARIPQQKDALGRHSSGGPPMTAATGHERLLNDVQSLSAIPSDS